MSQHKGYHFGGCCACRAPFLPATDFFYEPDCQAVFYLQARFHRLTLAGSPSDFTGSVENGHMLTCAHYSFAYAFARAMPLDRIDGPMRGDGVGGVPQNGVNCMTQTRESGRRRGAGPGAAGGGGADEPDAEAAAAVETAIAAGKTAAEIASAVKRTQKKKNEATAHWDRPEVYSHPALIDFLSGDGCKTRLAVDPDFTVPICTLCNDIFDTWARMGNLLTLEAVISPGAVEVTSTAGEGAGGVSIRIPDGRNMTTSKNLGLLLGYYMHRCLRGLHVNNRCDAALDSHRDYVCMMLFIPLHLTCFYLECTDGPIARKNKGQGKGVHNYMGCMDLLIAYYLFLCASVNDTNPGPLDFTRFSVFYIKELPDAPQPVWDSVLHPTLSKFIFDAGCPNDHAALVAYASNRLMALYEKCKPLVPLVKGAAVPVLTNLQSTAAAFFISAAEFDTALVAHFDRAHNPRNISYFIQHIGIAAIVWHVRRYLLSETPRLRELLDEWTRALLLKEWANIVENSPYDLTLSQAQLIYQMQNVLVPERLLGSADALGTGVELTLIRTIEREPILELVAQCGRCSVFKAAARLLKWNFVIRALPPVPYALESRLAPFSARLISLRSAMIAESLAPRSSASATGSAWPRRAARRRGCRGR
jgi:hypothetical protein